MSSSLSIKKLSTTVLDDDSMSKKKRVVYVPKLYLRHFQIMWEVSLVLLLMNDSRHEYNAKMSHLATFPTHTLSFSALEDRMSLQQQPAALHG